MERFLAGDNVCAWPNLTQMPDGRLIVTIFNQPAHGTLPGDIECWESRDEGRFWQRCGVPAPHAPGTNRMNVAVGLARDSALIVKDGSLLTAYYANRVHGHTRYHRGIVRWNLDEQLELNCFKY